MNLRIIIPVKPFAEAKQRLAPALNHAERAQIAERMFRHVLRTAALAFGASDLLVVSRSRDVLAIAEKEGACCFVESAPSDLNAALQQAARFAKSNGTPKLFVLASDLPLLGASDLTDIFSYDCAIAPDRHDRGTNALCWPHLPFAFGEDSFARHRDAAENAGLIPQIVRRRGLACDIDVPTDLVDIYPNFARSSGITRSA